MPQPSTPSVPKSVGAPAEALARCDYLSAVDPRLSGQPLAGLDDANQLLVSLMDAYTVCAIRHDGLVDHLESSDD